MKTYKNYINGEWRPSLGNRTLDSYNPANGEVWAKIPDSDSEDVNAAVKAAAEAHTDWKETSVSLRAELLNRLADYLSENIATFAKVESMDQGKTLQRARDIELPRCIENLRFFARLAQHRGEASFHGPGLNYTESSSLGVVALITPWNLPLYLLTWKLAPALMMGNTVVAKPSEWTSATAVLLAEAAIKVGLPPGVFNVVCGLGPKVGEALVNHPEVQAVSFTGGTKTGKLIASQTGSQLKKVSLELGGKNANIIFPDADIEKAIEHSTKAAFSNQGEICLCASRFYVHESIFERFTEEFVAKAATIRVGDPLLPETDMGPLVHKDHLNSVDTKVRKAIANGARVLLGGPLSEPSKSTSGYYFPPTIMTDVDQQWDIQQEEVFGPVVTLMPFSTVSEVIEKANDSSYGLSATIWTEKLSTAHVTAKKLHCGLVWVNTWMNRNLNTPFGGTKSSGLGREGGHWSLDFFSELKNICIEDVL